jgi:SAM-dependent methyltransferase
MTKRALPPRLLIKGFIRQTIPSPVLAILRRRRRGGIETLSARYCYAVWLRHLVKARDSGQSTDPRAVAELGPGASLGVGIAALLSGAERYVALDVIRHATGSANLAVFDELVDLLTQRTPIPGPDEYPEIRPSLGSLGFPSDILSDDRLQVSLAVERLGRLRELVRLEQIEYVVPWDDPAVIERGSIDLVFSQAVMEHVADLRHAYAAMYRWLKPGGLMSHQIDFRAHGTSPAWNGHWAYRRWLWRVTQGSPINRQPLSRHLAAIQEVGMSLVTVEAEQTDQGLNRDALAADWRWLTDGDLECPGVFIQAIRPT